MEDDNRMMRLWAIDCLITKQLEWGVRWFELHFSSLTGKPLLGFVHFLNENGRGEFRR